MTSDEAPCVHLCSHRGFCRLQLGTGARELAISDMVAACELGLDFGCKNAKALGKELRR